jgi:hypothetical protein
MTTASTDYTLNALTQAQDRQHAVGKLTMAGSLTAGNYIQLTVGFKPRYIRVCSNTSRIQVEWWEGMADDTCIKTAANGTRTIETTNKGLTPKANGFEISQNATLAAVAASDVVSFDCFG